MNADPVRYKQMEEGFRNTIGKALLDIDFEFRDFWCGLRPATPDDVPIVGPLKKYPNVYINGGHGGNGFLSIGTGKILSDLLLNDDKTDVDKEYWFLTPRRFNL